LLRQERRYCSHSQKDGPCRRNNFGPFRRHTQKHGNTSKRVWEKLVDPGESHNAGVDFTIMASTFLFEVVFRGNSGSTGEIHGSPASDQSVIVEVEPDSMVKTTIYIFSGDAARSKVSMPAFGVAARGSSSISRSVPS
jgi:hypothetical protein